MTKLDCIRLLGDVLVKIDVLRGSISPGTPEREKLDEFREKLNECQLQLADLVFKEGTIAYKDATSKLKVIYAEINEIIDDTNCIAETFETLKCMVVAIDDLLGLGFAG